jgi:hypothetical protein
MSSNRPLVNRLYVAGELKSAEIQLIKLARVTRNRNALMKFPQPPGCNIPCRFVADHLLSGQEA